MSQGSGEKKASRQSIPVNGNNSVDAVDRISKARNGADLPHHSSKRRKVAGKAAVPNGVVRGSEEVSAGANWIAGADAAGEAPAGDLTAQTATDRSTEAACPTPAEAAQATALELLEQGTFGNALAASTAAGKLLGGAQLEAQLATLRLICRLHLAGPTATCWQILGVPEGAAAEDVRRAFRRGAQRVHPDKCRLPRAEAAFKILKAAAESAHAAGGSSSTAAPDVAAGFGSYDNSGGGAAWWQEWEPSASEAQQQQQQQRQQQQQAPHRPRPWQPPADSDAQVLTTLTTQALRAEVVRRQGALLSPEPSSEEASMDPSIRQARLREARSLLAERLKAEEAIAFAETAGGFQRQPSPLRGM